MIASVVMAVLVLGAHASTARSSLVWRSCENAQAVCNDFTQAGYFINRNHTDSGQWLIFLESGGLCYSNDTCNRRYFTREVRQRFARPQGEARDFPPYGNFDPEEAWNATRTAGEHPNTVINPLMSSMECFVNRQEYFPSGLQVDGKDILDPDCGTNPHFCNYNHVLLPYCSSDVWLGDETDSARRGACHCFDQNCFQFRPQSNDLQFTFRGKVIFESVIRELLEMGMRDATEVVLAGSSAGGLGALNLAKWTREQLPANADLLVIFDSSWFINFQGNILQEFNGTVNQMESEASSASVLLPLLERHPSCADTQLGYPCCLSAHCVLTERGHPNNTLLYYPQGVKTFGVFGLYDVFLLARSLQGTRTVQDQRTPVGFALDFLRTVGEYGGGMNETLAAAAPKTPSFSYYVTECFQHIYLATSTLWGMGSLFGTSSIEVGSGIASFTHEIQSGIWSSRLLATEKSVATNQSTTPDTTIQEAILQWYTNRNSTTFEFRDVCVGPHCNRECPETFSLGELTSNNWPFWAKILIVSIVLGIATLALFMVLLFKIWLFVLERKQDSYLTSLDSSNDVECSISDFHLQFPVCDESEAVSVACLDLTYSVTFRVKKVKDEKKDNLTPVVLRDITTEDDSEEEEEGDPFSPSRHGSFQRSGHHSRRRKKSSQMEELVTAFKHTVDKARKSPRPMDETSFTELTQRCSPSPLPPSSLSSSPSPTSPLSPKLDAEIQTSVFGRRKLEILRGISMYFNPRQLIGIMGPSGCGKTTFLDLLTGRRKSGNFSGEIYVNGKPMDQVRDWYIANTGYVLQLATPYYEELTVRENLTLAAQIKLPNSYTTREKFKRVEQVMGVTGLMKLADTRVGGATGPGLSGGQKRRLAVALQLLKLPSVIFLDEPTSGLDAASSFELLTHLNKLADSNRTVILTIHQPRLEIFHMFHRLMLISDGKVAYHGVPEKAYEVFVSALTTRFLEQGLVIPELEDHNPADLIMDMLGTQKMRRFITEYYHASNEPKLVKSAITASRWRAQSLSMGSRDSVKSTITFTLFGARKVGRVHADVFSRWAALEARGSKRATLGQLLYLPIIFFGYGVLLGTVYFQQRLPLLVVSGFCVYSVASALFMFPALYLYYQRALEVYSYEHADGVGRAGDLVIQGFIRFITMAAIPVVICAGVLYLLLVNSDSYNFEVFGQVVIINLALNQTWTALLIALICAFPAKAFRLSPVVSSVAGFTSGFFIPINDIPWWYRWLSYINPNYYGFSSSAFLLLTDFNTGCRGTRFECYPRSGRYVLNQFDFNNVNPYLHITILLGFTLFYLFLATFSNWVRHTSILSTFKRVKLVIKRKESMMEEPQKVLLQDREEDGREMRVGGDQNAQREYEIVAVRKKPSLNPINPLSPIVEEENSQERPCPPPPISVRARRARRARVHWKRAAEKSLNQLQNGSLEQESEEEAAEIGSDARRDSSERPSNLDFENTPKKTPKHRSLFLGEGDGHMVWQPKLYHVVTNVMKNKRRAEKTAEPEKPVTPEEKSLSERQRTLAYRIRATRAVLKEQNEELINEDVEPSEHKKHISLRDASQRISENLKRQKSESSEKVQFTDIVSQYIEQQQNQEYESSGVETPLVRSAGLRPSPRQRHHSTSARNASTPGVIPIRKWRQMCREHRDLQRAKTDYNFRNIPPFEERRHSPVARTTSDPDMAPKRKMGVTALGMGTHQMDNSGVSSERHPGNNETDQHESQQCTAKSTEQKSPQNALLRSLMHKQTHVSDSTDSLIENTSSADTRTREERSLDMVRDDPDSCGPPHRSRTPSPKPWNGVSKKPIKGVEMNGSLPTGIASRVNSSLTSLPTGITITTSSQRFPSQESLDEKTLQSTFSSESTPDNPCHPPSSSSQKKSRTPTRDGSVSPAFNPQKPSSAEAVTASQSKQRQRSEPSLQGRSSTSSDQ